MSYVNFESKCLRDETRFFSRRKVEMIENFSGNSFDVENVKNGKKIEETNVKSNKVF